MFITFTATSRAARLFHRQLYDARSTAKLNLAADDIPGHDEDD